MAIAISSLIRISPFSDEDRNKLLSKIDNLNEDQKIQIVKTCWKILALKYHAKVKFMSDLVLEDIREGKRKLNNNDFIEIEAKITHEFADLLKYAETQEQIEEVKQNLQKHKAL